MLRDGPPSVSSGTHSLNLGSLQPHVNPNPGKVYITNSLSVSQHTERCRSDLSRASFWGSRVTDSSRSLKWRILHRIVPPHPSSLASLPWKLIYAFVSLHRPGFTHLTTSCGKFPFMLSFQFCKHFNKANLYKRCLMFQRTPILGQGVSATQPPALSPEGLLNHCS